jgi:hypothetical protein
MTPSQEKAREFGSPADCSEDSMLPRTKARIIFCLFLGAVCLILIAALFAWVFLGAVCLVLIAALIAYVYWPYLQRWRYRDARRWADAQHVEVALPLDGKEAASTCGKRLKIDIWKLDILERMRQVVRNSGFSDEEIKELGSLLGEMAYWGYTFGYLTFDKYLQSVELHFDEVVKKNINSFLNKPSSEQRKQMEDKPLQSVKMQFDDEVKMYIDSFLNKLSSEQRNQMYRLLPRINQMQLRALDLGRRDARLSPCPY